MSNLIALIFLLLPTYLIRFTPFGIPTTVLEILIYIVLLVGLWRAYRSGFKKIPLKIWLPIGLLIIALVISTIVSPDKRTAMGEFKGFFIDPMLVGWLIFQFIKKENLTKIFWALILAGAFVAGHTIVKRFLGIIEPGGRVVGIFGYSPNYTSLFLAPIVVLLACLLLSMRCDYRLLLIRNKYLRWSVVCGLLAILLLAIFFSGSRGGFLAIIAGLGIFAVANYWGWIKERISAKIIIAILIIAGIYTAWTVFRPNFSASPEAGRVASSNNVRWQIWQESIKLGFKHPILGVGLGNFQPAFGKFTQNIANFPEFITPLALTPHNNFFMFWLSTGLLGLAAFIWLIVAFYFQALKNSAKVYAPIILACMSAILLYGLIETSIWKNDLSIIFWGFWAMIWIDNAKFKNQNAK